MCRGSACVGAINVLLVSVEQKASMRADYRIGTQLHLRESSPTSYRHSPTLQFFSSRRRRDKQSYHKRMGELGTYQYHVLVTRLESDSTDMFVWRVADDESRIRSVVLFQRTVSLKSVDLVLRFLSGSCLHPRRKKELLVSAIYPRESKYPDRLLP